MYNLLRFIKQNESFFLFLIIQIISVYLLISNNNFQNSKFIAFSNQYVGIVYDYSNILSEYLYLKKKNDYLAMENAKLFTVLNKREGGGEEIFNKDNFVYESAKVINNSIHKRNNYLTLDKGEKHGILKGMGVITQNGVIGIIHSTSKNYSVVMSLLHRKSAVSIKLKKNNHNGILVWKGDDYRKVNITNFPGHILINKGDTIITNMHSMIFPEGINIGSVDKLNQDDEGYYNVVVDLFEDFNQINYVYIVNSSNSLEKHQLENILQNE